MYLSDDRLAEVLEKQFRMCEGFPDTWVMDNNGTDDVRLKTPPLVESVEALIRKLQTE